MQSSLQTQSVPIKALGRDVEIRELSGATQIAMLEQLRAIRERCGETPESFSPADNIRMAAITCAGCVIEWEGETPDSILESHSAEALLEIAAAVQKKRKPRPKNSESAPSDDSSSGSP